MQTTSNHNTTEVLSCLKTTRKEAKELRPRKTKSSKITETNHKNTTRGDGRELVFRLVAAWWRWKSSLIRYAPSTTSLDSCWKIRRIHSFQIIHQKYIIRPSKVGFCSLLKTFGTFSTIGKLLVELLGSIVEDQAIWLHLSKLHRYRGNPCKDE